MKLIKMFVIFMLLMFTSISFVGIVYAKKKGFTVKEERVFMAVEKHAVSIVSIGRSIVICSGVVMGKTENYTIIITCKHCIRVSEEMFVEGNKVEAIITDTKDDLAYLMVKGTIKNKESVRLATRNELVDTKVYHIGFPRGLQSRESYKACGKIIRYTGDWGWAAFKVIGGCSGGGIFNEEGKLVGILWGSVGTGDNSASIFEPIEDIRAFLGKINK